VAEYSTDPDLDDLHPGLGNVLFDSWLVSRAATARIDGVIGASGLNAEEFAVYSVLAGTEGMTPTELAQWMVAPPTTVSSYVKRLERRGHVRRVPDPTDRRSHRVELTDLGRAAHRKAGELFEPFLNSVNRRLGAGVTETHRRLRAMRRVLDQVD